MKADPLWDNLFPLTDVLSHEPPSDVPQMSFGRRTDDAGLFINNKEGDSIELSAEDDCDNMVGDGVGNCTLILESCPEFLLGGFSATRCLP